MARDGGLPHDGDGGLKGKQGAESSTAPISRHFSQPDGTKWGLWRIIRGIREMLVGVFPDSSIASSSRALKNPPRS